MGEGDHRDGAQAQTDGGGGVIRSTKARSIVILLSYHVIPQKCGIQFCGTQNLRHSAFFLPWVSHGVSFFMKEGVPANAGEVVVPGDEVKRSHHKKLFITTAPSCSLHSQSTPSFIKTGTRDAAHRF